MIPSNYSSRRNNQRLMQDRASSSSTSSSRSLDQARSASASNSSSRYQSARDDFARSSTFRGIDITRRAAQQDRASSSSTSSSQNPANQSTTRTDYRTNPAQAELLASIRRRDRLSSMHPSMSVSSSQPALTAASVFSALDDRLLSSHSLRASELSSFEHPDVASYMTSPTYEDASMPDGADLDGISSSLDQLSLARRLTGQFDSEYRDQEYGSRSRHNR